MPNVTAETRHPMPLHADTLRQRLASAIAWRHDGPPWHFYEQLDALLGPWGEGGYPLGYGRRYCQAFCSLPTLRDHAIGLRWVQTTTVLLQETLADYVVRHVRAGSPIALTESALRRFAFASHPRCYLDGGLQRVLLSAPELIPIIGLLPWRELLPWSSSACAAWKQTAATLGHLGGDLIRRQQSFDGRYGVAFAWA